MAWWEHQNQNIPLGYLALLYDSRIKRKPKKLETTWVVPYIVEELNANGSIRIKALQGQVFKEVLNGARLKRYHT